MARSLWIWHRRMGLTLLLPLLWWTLTGLIFSVWAIDHVRGRSYASGEEAPRTELPAGVRLPEEWLRGAEQVRVRSVEGAALAIVRGPAGDQLYELDTGSRLGAVIPVEWALRAATRDFAPEAPVREIWLYDAQGQGRLVGPAAEEMLATTESLREIPDEYGGPRPVYAVHFDHGSGMHLYVDALTAEIRSRRSSVWRFYDWAFRLHALSIVSDGSKRVIMIPMALLWLAVGISGLLMWIKLGRRSRKARTARRQGPA